MIRKLPAVLILIAAIILMQSHAITWWTQHDAATGWLWAIAIEAGAVWLWSRRGAITTGMAIIATTLALIAPLADLAASVLEQQRSSTQAADTLPQRTATTEARIATLEASLAQYLSNSEYRSGWHSLIVSTEQQLTAARADLASLQTEQQTPAPATLAVWLPLLMQMAAVCLLQCLIVMTTRTLTRPAPKTTAGTQHNTNEDKPEHSLTGAVAQLAIARPKPDAKPAGQRGKA
jgi:hypothetical protein